MGTQDKNINYLHNFNVHRQFYALFRMFSCFYIHSVSLKQWSITQREAWWSIRTWRTESESWTWLWFLCSALLIYYYLPMSKKGYAIKYKILWKYYASFDYQPIPRRPYTYSKKYFSFKNILQNDELWQKLRNAWRQTSV